MYTLKVSSSAGPVPHVSLRINAVELCEWLKSVLRKRPHPLFPIRISAKVFPEVEYERTTHKMNY